jgi:hypothetical protein
MHVCVYALGNFVCKHIKEHFVYSLLTFNDAKLGTNSE